jgi:hypothetical protein
MLVKQIHAAWQANNGAASLLSLDMTGALDRVVPVGLLQNFTNRCIPQLLVQVLSFFLSNISTSLCYPGYSSSLRSSEQSVPQGPPLYLIFSFFTMLIL